MKRALLAGFVGVAAALSSGCGTLWNLAFNSKGPEAYGGVQKDIDFIMTPRKEPYSDNLHATGTEALVLLAIIPTEVCMSFFGDTLTLPYVVYLNHRDRDDDASSDSSGNTVNPGNPATPEAVLDRAVPLNWGNVASEEGKCDARGPAQAGEIGPDVMGEFPVRLLPPVPDLVWPQ